MGMIIRIYFSFNLNYAYLCAPDWKGQWIKVHMKENRSPQQLLSSTLLSLFDEGLLYFVTKRDRLAYHFFVLNTHLQSH